MRMWTGCVSLGTVCVSLGTVCVFLGTVCVLLGDVSASLSLRHNGDIRTKESARGGEGNRRDVNGTYGIIQERDGLSDKAARDRALSRGAAAATGAFSSRELHSLIDPNPNPNHTLMESLNSTNMKMSETRRRGYKHHPHRTASDPHWTLSTLDPHRTPSSASEPHRTASDPHRTLSASVRPRDPRHRRRRKLNAETPSLGLGLGSSPALGLGLGSSPALGLGSSPALGLGSGPGLGPGGHNTAKPPSMGGRRPEENNESDRRGRGTKDEKKALKGGRRKKLNKSLTPSPTDALQTPVDALGAPLLPPWQPQSAPLLPWEPLPRPAAALTATDVPPLDLYTRRNEEFFTYREENPWDATPMTPPNAQDDFFFGTEIRNPFYPVTSETYGAYAVTGAAGVIFLAGVLGNVAILCIVCQNYYMKSISNSLIANLAVWDFSLVFVCLPLVIFHELTKTWLLGEFTCKVVPYLEVASLGVTTFTLCALCIDRFRAATNVQMYYEMIENCTSTSAKLAVIWVGALLLALPELLLRQLVTEDDPNPDEPPAQRCLVRISPSLPDTLYVLGLTYQGARLWWCFGCYFCLPTLFTIGCSLVTARKIRRAEQASVRGNKKQIRLESQMNCTVVALAIVYGACVVPENICNMVSAYMAAGVPERTMALLHLLSQLLLFLRAAVTPALLLLLCRPLGRAFLDCCCCCCQACQGHAHSATASDDNEHECTTELELSPFSTIRRELSNYTPA